MESLAFLTDIFNIGIGSVTIGAIISALILLLICITIIKLFWPFIFIFFFVIHHKITSTLLLQINI